MYHADCTLCHTIYPRLNRTGYEFRRHGYRFIRGDKPGGWLDGVGEHALQTSAEAVSAGRALVTRLRCMNCHRVEGEGGKVGPALDGVGKRRSAEWIAAQITRPTEHNPATVMPPAQVDGAQLRLVTAYLSSLETRPDSEEATPRHKALDYVGAMWTPAIRVAQTGGPAEANYDTRELTLFLTGAFGPHVSTFAEFNPTVENPGFGDLWGEAQGVLYWGAPQQYGLVRGGQILALQGAGFGATDRVFSDALPLIYNPVNGFAPGRYVRGGSGEYSFGAGSTLKLFGGTSSDQSRSTGAVWEQVIGKQGLSGITVEFAGGSNPHLVDGPGATDLHFRRLIVAGNRTFQDSRNRERLNVLGAVMVGDDNFYLGGDANRRSHAYGSYVEVDAVPVPRMLGAYVRVDQVRATTTQDGSIYAGTAGLALNVTRYGRLLLEYQRYSAATQNNFYTIGFRLNF